MVFSFTKLSFKFASTINLEGSKMSWFLFNIGGGDVLNKWGILKLILSLIFKSTDGIGNNLAVSKIGLFRLAK